MMLRSNSALRLAALLLASLLLAACGGGTPGQPGSTDAPAAEATAAPTEAAPAAAAPTEAPAAAEATAAPTEAAPAAEVSPAETLVFATNLNDQISMDPAVVYEFGGIQVVGSIYETLVSFEPGDPTLKPVLAKEWEVVDSGDMWTLTFMLDEAARFASGNPVSAEDVIYSWGRVIDLNKSPAFLLIDVAKLTKENLKAVDAQTLEVKLPKDVSPQVFLSVLSFSVAAVVDRQVVEANAGSDMGSTWMNDNSAGSGPYVLESWERGSQNVLAANPNYWRTPPAIKRVIMRNEPELANLQAAIETGDADIVQGLGAEQVAALEGNPDLQIVKSPSLLLAYLGMNAKTPPLDNVDVREAIRYAINYDDITTLLGGNGTVVQEVIPNGLFGHTGQNPFKQDIAKAKELMAKAGVAEGTQLEMLVATGAGPGGIEWGTLGAKLQSDLQQIGLQLNIKQIQFSELLNIYREQKGQLVLANWGPDFPDPDGNVTPFTNYDAQSIAWRNAWEAPEIAELGKQAAVEQDQAKRAELYKQLTERVLHEGPYAILYQPTTAYGVRANIQGFQPDPVDTPGITFALISKQ
jgi:peptide/nickel transport system substrate-binding protein